MYHLFNIKKLNILCTECIYVLRMVARISSDYFPKRQ
jgi:hypothetical protein